MTIDSDATVPRMILENVEWSFVGARFDDRTEFEEKVRLDQDEFHSLSSWRPRQIVLALPRIHVMYQCWRGDEQVEPIIEFTSDNGRDFSAGELLFKIHNAVVADLEAIDHHFFQGLALLRPPLGEVPPLYRMSQGS